LGALAGCRALPMTAGDFEAAIREGGVAVERNVRGLKAGVELLAAGPPAETRPAARRWAELRAERAAALGRRGADFTDLAARGEAVARLIDYQDRGYALVYLDRVRALRALNRGLRLVEAFARRLAVWMTYE